MLTGKDFEICVKALNDYVLNNDDVDAKRVIRKLELVIKAENIKTKSENDMMAINDELRKIFDEERAGE